MYYSHCALECVKGSFLALVREPLGEDFLLRFDYVHTIEDASERFPDAPPTAGFLRLLLMLTLQPYCVPS